MWVGPWGAPRPVAGTVELPELCWFDQWSDASIQGGLEAEIYRTTHLTDEISLAGDSARVK